MSAATNPTVSTPSRLRGRSPEPANMSAGHTAPRGSTGERELPPLDGEGRGAERVPGWGARGDSCIAPLPALRATSPIEGREKTPAPHVSGAKNKGAGWTRPMTSSWSAAARPGGDRGPVVGGSVLQVASRPASGRRRRPDPGRLRRVAAQSRDRLDVHRPTPGAAAWGCWASACKSARAHAGNPGINHGLVHGHPGDYDHWAELGAEGWSYAEVLPLFRKLEDFTPTNAITVDGDAHGRGGPVGVTVPCRRPGGSSRRQPRPVPRGDYTAAATAADRQAWPPAHQHPQGAPAPAPTSRLSRGRAEERGRTFPSSPRPGAAHRRGRNGK